MGEIRLSHSTTVQDHQRIDSCIHTVDYRTPVWTHLLLRSLVIVSSVDLNDARAIHDDARGATLERGVDFT